MTRRCGWKRSPFTLWMVVVVSSSWEESLKRSWSWKHRCRNHVHAFIISSSRHFVLTPTTTKPVISRTTQNHNSLVPAPFFSYQKTTPYHPRESIQGSQKRYAHSTDQQTRTKDCTVSSNNSENQNISTSNQQRRRKRTFSQQSLHALQSPNVTFPFIIPLDVQEDDTHNNETTTNAILLAATTTTTTTTAATGDNQEEELVLRFMTPNDLQRLLPLCIQEFGDDSISSLASTATSSVAFRSTNSNDIPVQMDYHCYTPTSIFQNFPWKDPHKIPQWCNQFWLEQMISLALLWKLKANHDQPFSSLSSTTSSNYNNNNIADPAMLVLCRRWRQPTPIVVDDDVDGRCCMFQNENIDEEETKQEEQRIPPTTFTNDEIVIGMVELSLQPPDYDRNPPPWPLPLWVKDVLAKHTTYLGTLQGWVTNLLLDSNYRGLHYSKILMAATEGIAKKWNCSFIFLHADADIHSNSGRISQSLYKSLGYQIVTTPPMKKRKKKKSNGAAEDDDDYTWAGANSGLLGQLSSIRMIDGVALLCLSKKITNVDN